MQKIFVLLIFSVVFSLFSCGKKETEQQRIERLQEQAKVDSIAKVDSVRSALSKHDYSRPLTRKQMEKRVDSIAIVNPNLAEELRQALQGKHPTQQNRQNK